MSFNETNNNFEAPVPNFDYFDKLSNQMHEEYMSGHTPAKGHSTTSTLSHSIPVMPPTPRKAHTQFEAEILDIFSGLLDSQHEENPQLANYNTRIKNVSFEKVYRSEDGHPHSLIKQCTKRGPASAALLMLWADKQRSSADLPATIEDGFWNSMASGRWLQSEEITRLADQYLQIKLASRPIENLNQIQEVLNMTNQPVIASITHPEKDCHMILIDQIDSEAKTITLRDPSAGEAYMIGFGEANKWFSDGSGECFYHTAN